MDIVLRHESNDQLTTLGGNCLDLDRLGARRRLSDSDSVAGARTKRINWQDGQLPTCA